MKTSFRFLGVFFALSIVATLSQADSFNCDSSAQDHLNVRIQDNVDAASGTRTAAILLVTDTQATFGSRTLVASKNLIQNGAFWTANMPSNSSETSGQMIGEFDRSEVSKVQLYIPTFNFNEGNKDGAEYPGHLFLFKDENTETFSQDIELNCVYLTKNLRD